MNVLDIMRGKPARSLPSAEFLTDDMLANARALAHWYQKEQARPGTAVMIYTLVAEVEKLREAAKGSLVIVQQACKSADLANLKASVLLMIAEKLAPIMDIASEQRRRQSGNTEDWARLQALADELNATIKLAKE